MRRPESVHIHKISGHGACQQCREGDAPHSPVGEDKIRAAHCGWHGDARNRNDMHGYTACGGPDVLAKPQQALAADWPAMVCTLNNPVFSDTISRVCNRHCGKAAAQASMSECLTY